MTDKQAEIEAVARGIRNSLWPDGDGPHWPEYTDEAEAAITALDAHRAPKVRGLLTDLLSDTRAAAQGLGGDESARETKRELLALVGANEETKETA